MLHRFRFLMAPEGDGLTAAVVPAANGAPAADAPAQGTAAVPANAPLDAAALANAISGKVFADLRKAGVLDAIAAGKNGTAAAAPVKPDGEKPPAAAPQQQDVHAILALRDAFDDAMGDTPLKATQKALLRENVMRDRPDDVTAYVAKFVERAGWSTTPAATNNQPAPGPQAGAPPAAGPGMPGATPPARVITADTSIFDMSPTDQAALAARLGPFETKKRMLDDAARTQFRFSLRK